APGTGVTFVGGDQIGAAVGAVGVDGVGQVQTDHAAEGADIDFTVLVAGVDAVAFDAQILLTQGQDVGDRGAGDVHFGQGIVFLQGHPGSAAVIGDGDVFRLQVLGDAGAGAVEAHAFGLQVGCVVRGEGG